MSADLKQGQCCHREPCDYRRGWEGWRLLAQSTHPFLVPLQRAKDAEAVVVSAFTVGASRMRYNWTQHADPDPLQVVEKRSQQKYPGCVHGEVAMLPVALAGECEPLRVSNFVNFAVA